MTIRNPVIYGWDQVRSAAVALEGLGRREEPDLAAPDHLMVRRIQLHDIRHALARGLEDFSADPTHYVFLCALYPLLGLVLAKLAYGSDLVPLVFPLIAGFALLGPLAAVGIYELSRRREAGEEVAWWHAFNVFRSPAIGDIVKLALLLTAVFVVWLLAADLIYRYTIGPDVPASAAWFFHAVFTTPAGWALIVIGNAVGFLFAVLVLVVGAVSFQTVVDHHVTAEMAIRTSIRAARLNPGPMAAWGLTIAVLLVLGSIPLLLGLAVVMPVLGHASWHLYRRMVAP